MKKYFLLVLIGFLLVMKTAIAQTNPEATKTLLCKKWVVVKMTTSNGQTVKPSTNQLIYITYFKDGALEEIIDGVKTKGTWVLDEKTMVLKNTEIESDGKLQPEDPVTITTLTDTSLVVRIVNSDGSPGAIYFAPAQ